MGKRRANKEGTVRQRADGRFEARLSYEDPHTGKRRRISAYGATRKAAMAELDKARDRVQEGQPPRDSSTTVGGWLAHWRVTALAASGRKQSTKELYANLSRKHLEREPFGGLRLDRLRPSHIDGLILTMRAKTKPGKRIDEETKPEPVRALSDSTIRQTYTVLRAGLDGAVRDGLLARNPAAAVRRPGIEQGEAKYLTSDDVSMLLRAAEGSRWGGTSMSEQRRPTRSVGSVKAPVCQKNGSNKSSTNTAYPYLWMPVSGEIRRAMVTDRSAFTPKLWALRTSIDTTTPTTTTWAASHYAASPTSPAATPASCNRTG